MIEKQTLSSQVIIKCLNIDYGIDVASLSFLRLGADINASVYQAQSYDGAAYFIKIKRGHDHGIGVVVTQLLHDAGIEEIIPPIKTLSGQLTQRIGEFTLIVYPFIKGQDGFNCDLTDNQWFKLGKALRRIHEIEVPAALQKELRREYYSPKWREVLRSLFVHVEAQTAVDEIALKLLQFMQGNMPAIRRLVDRAEQLGQKMQNQTTKFTLCHSDIHGGNVLVNENDTIYIVDWDDPIMAPKERDLMFIGGGVANVWNKRHEEESFYRGYGMTEINSTILAYYRHERIVEDIAVYGHQLLLTTVGGDNRSQMYQHFIDMFEPNGVVDIAFETYDGLITYSSGIFHAKF